MHNVMQQRGILLFGVAIVAFIVTAGFLASNLAKQGGPSQTTTGYSTYTTGTQTSTTTVTKTESGSSIAGSSKTTVTDVDGNVVQTKSEHENVLAALMAAFGPPLDTVSVKNPDGSESVFYNSLTGVSGSITEEFSFTPNRVQEAWLHRVEQRWEMDGAVIAKTTDTNIRQLFQGSKVALPPLKALGSDVYSAIKRDVAVSKTLIYNVDLLLVFSSASFADNWSSDYRQIIFKAASLEVAFKPEKNTVTNGNLDSKTLPTYDFSLFLHVTTPRGGSVSVLAEGSIFKGYDDGPGGSGAPLYEPVEGVSIRVDHGKKVQTSKILGSTVYYDYVLVGKGGTAPSAPSITSYPSSKTIVLGSVELFDTVRRGAAIIGLVEDLSGGSIGWMKITVAGGEATDVYANRKVIVKAFESQPMVVIKPSLSAVPQDVGLRWAATPGMDEGTYYGWIRRI